MVVIRLEKFIFLKRAERGILILTIGRISELVLMELKICKAVFLT